MKKEELDKFIEEVLKQVINGVKQAREDSGMTILYPEYIDFKVQVDEDFVDFRVLTK